MIQERALILDKESKDEGFVWVRTQRQSACESCKLKSGCGQGVLNKLSSERSMEFQVKNTLSARAGDVVIVGIPEDGVLTASFVMYFMPLLTMLGLAGITSQFSGNQLYIVISGLLGLLAGFWWARRYSQKHKTDPRFVPVLVGLALASPEGSACAES